MRKKKFSFIVLSVIAFYSSSVFCQETGWRELVPLKSDRSEVEKILGRPTTFFETYGNYKTPIGKFHAWYAQGGCKQSSEGLQWNVPASKLTKLLFYPKKAVTLDFYLASMEGFVKQPSPGGFSRFLYTAADDSITYQTIVSKNLGEIVNSIELDPNKAMQHLLCKK